MSSELYFKLIRTDNKYHDGLNIGEINMFDYFCITERLCFCKPENIGKYLYDYEVTYLCDVYLPMDDPELKVMDYENGEYGANKIILKNQRDLREISTWEYMISNGLNIFDEKNKSLFWACVNNYTNIIKYLVEKGIDVNINNGSNLDELIRRKNFDNLKFLIENGANIKSITKSLHSTICVGNIDMVKYLIESGADINGEFNDSILAASIYGHKDIIDYLLKNGPNFDTINNGLMEASGDCFMSIIKYLLESGIDINYNNSFALDIACKNKHLSAIKYLLDNGSDINIRRDTLERLGTQFDIIKLLVERGLDKKSINILLISACFCLRLDIIKYLIESGADVHIENDSPLIKAIYSGVYRDNKAIVQYLIENGANIHVDNNKPLILACEKDQLEMVKLLIDYGANICTNSDEILQKTIIEGHNEILKYLIECGIDIYIRENEYIRLAKENKHLRIVDYLKSLDE
ncbi:putative ankyrin repeat protein [Saudi moumouvirus]|nr:putative ankyrin repeat protein [Saudi moumouvirus]